jgi:hypothetical protein
MEDDDDDNDNYRRLVEDLAKQCITNKKKEKIGVWVRDG